MTQAAANLDPGQRIRDIRCGKDLYTSYEYAQECAHRFEQRSSAHIELDIYPCPHTDNGWHLTSERWRNSHPDVEDPSMPTSPATSDRLAKRCMKAGWQVSDDGDGYTVTTGTNKTFIIQPSYPNRAAYDDAEKQLIALGLAKAEKNAANAEETARKARILADREANEKRLAEAAAKAQERAAAQEKLLKRAVGGAGSGYLTVEKLGLDWFVNPQPTMMVKAAFIDRDIADYLLEHINNDNRNLRTRRAERYRDVILSGQWKMTHQGLAIDTRGVLQDGQHRLMGIKMAYDALKATQTLRSGDIKWDGSPLPMIVFTGVDPANYDAIDEGLLRTAGDVLAAGNVGLTYTTNVASTIRLCMALMSSNPRTASRGSMTNADVARFYEEHDSTQIIESVRYAMKHYKATKINFTALAVAHYMLRHANGATNTYLAAFFDGIATGCYSHSRLMLDDLDPRAVTRKYVANAREKKQRVSAINHYILIITAWNNLVAGRRVSYASVADDTDVPTIRICKPEDSAAPSYLAIDMRFINEQNTIKETAA